MIKGLICRDCWKVVKASGEHWLEDCEDPTIHPGMVQAYLDEADSHSEMILTPTTALGKPRAEFIRRTMDTYPEAQGFNSMGVGSAVGERVEKGMLAFGFERQIGLEGEILGHKMKGTGDLWWREKDGKKQLRIFADNKFRGERSFWYQYSRGRLASKEDSAQVSMYVHLAHQMGIPISSKEVELVVWVGSIRAVQDYRTKKYLPTWMKCRAQMMSEQEIGELHPYQMETTVAENMNLLDDAFKRAKAGEDPMRILQAIPASCIDIFDGQACRNYCGENRVCLGAMGFSGGDWARKKMIEVRLPEATSLPKKEED